MTDGIEPIVWTAGALLGLVTLVFAGASFLPSILFHEQRTKHPRDGRSFVTNGRVFCRVQDADIGIDQCVGCKHLRVLDGRGSYIVCDGRAAAAVSLEL